MKTNRAGTSQDAKAAAAVKFAHALAEHKGGVTNDEIAAVRNAGYSDADISEIILHVGMNLITNIAGKAGRVDIDFPKVECKRSTNPNLFTPPFRWLNPAHANSTATALQPLPPSARRASHA